MPKLAIYWLTLLFFLLSGTSVAYAHANLLTNTPSNMEVVPTTPERVTLHFSEPLEADLIDIQLYDWNAKEIDLPPPDLVKGDASTMTAHLPELYPGTYTVVWQVVSEDGHPVKGSFAFSVGTASDHHTHPNQVTSDGPNPWLASLRYLIESMLVIGGGLYFFTRASVRYQLPDADQLLNPRTRRTLWLLLVLLTVAQWFVYSSTLPGTGLSPVLLQGNLALLLENPFALMTSVQLLLLLLVALPGMQNSWYGLVWVLLISNLAIGGHAWGIEPRWLSLTLRVLHLLSLALWLGGLAYLTLTFVYAKRGKLHLNRSAFRAFFTRLAVLATVLLTVSGVLMVNVQTDWSLLFSGDLWSNLLFLKIALMAMMLLIAAVQTLRWRRDDRNLSHAGLRLELLIGAFTVFVAILISQMAYPMPTKSYAETVTATESTEQATVHISTLSLGNQTLTAQLPTQHGASPTKVTLFLVMPEMDTGEQEITASRTASGEYQATLGFSMVGTWQYTIEATYPHDIKLRWTDTVHIP